MEELYNLKDLSVFFDISPTSLKKAYHLRYFLRTHYDHNGKKII